MLCFTWKMSSAIVLNNGLSLSFFLSLWQIPSHIEILVSAVTQINEPDSLYGIIQSHKVSLFMTFYWFFFSWILHCCYFQWCNGNIYFVQLGSVIINFWLEIHIICPKNVFKLTFWWNLPYVWREEKPCFGC